MRSIWLASALLLGAHVGAAQQSTSAESRTPESRQPTSQPSAPAVRIDYIEDSLPNGLRVLYHVDHSTPVAAVDIWYNVGSKHEVTGRTGFAHLFEHMMFKGSRNVADGQHFSLLEAAGG